MNGNTVLLVACGLCAILFPPSIRSENACEGEPNGYTMSIPGACSDFHLCQNGHRIRLTCGAMYFNAKTHSCDAPEAVDCDREVEEPTATTTTENMCERQPNGHLIASVENCREFYVCVGKVALPRTCGWMHFNAQAGRCVDPRFFQCDLTKLKPKSRPFVKFFQESGPILLTN